MSAILKNLWLRNTILVIVVAVFMGIVNAAAHGEFLNPRNLVTVLEQISYNCILGVGQTFVIITAGIDLSIGSLVALTGVVMAQTANHLSFGGVGLVLVTLLAGLAVGAAAGWINALPVVKLNLPPFITTFAMLEVTLGLSYIFSGGQPVAVNNPIFSAIGTGSVFGLPVPVIWMVVVVAIASVVLTRTRFGRYVFALGGNEEAARLAGIATARVKTLVYVISGMCAAVVGFLYMARFSSGSPDTGTHDELLEAIAAVVVGGTSLMGGQGSILGTFFGALLIGLLYNAMNLIHVDSYLQKVVLGVVILLAVVLDELRKRYLAKA
ncbi:MAG: ABC transporter permease [Candidatus Aquilonibacter sp.]|jgi:ribose/xylose/arabinose/galactoside ABC-type transport system permease subunit